MCEHLTDRFIIFVWIWNRNLKKKKKKSQRSADVFAPFSYLTSCVFLFVSLCVSVCVCGGCCWCFHAACLCPLWLGRETLPLTAPERESAAGRARAWQTLLEHAYDSTDPRYRKNISNPNAPTLTLQLCVRPLVKVFLTLWRRVPWFITTWILCL